MLGLTATKIGRPRKRGRSRYPRTLNRKIVLPLVVIAGIAIFQEVGGRIDIDGIPEVVRGGTREAPSRAMEPVSGDSFSGKVTRVADGDTFTLDCCRQRVRLWGIDAPERDQAGGSAATDALSRLISGRTLTCARRDVDRYGRLVGQCALPDGRDVGSAILATGTVDEYCRYSGNFYGRC